MKDSLEYWVFNELDGLPSSWIVTTVQDDAGDIWVGTYADGIGHIVSADSMGIIVELFDTSSGLSDPFITVMEKDDFGRIWYGTKQGGLGYIEDQIVHSINEPSLPSGEISCVVFDEQNQTRATLVNYACHPTTLAWENDQLSPDFPGAMREIVEGATDAPCLFLQGASGELAPCEQYVGDSATADRHGRVLGHAAMSLLEMLAPGMGDMVYDGALESGAPLALWSPSKGEAATDVAAAAPSIDLPLKSDLPSLTEIQAELAEQSSGFAYERLVRQLRVRQSVGDGKVSSERISRPLRSITMLSGTVSIRDLLKTI